MPGLPCSTHFSTWRRPRIEDVDSDNAEECDAERRGDWHSLETLYLKKLASDEAVLVIVRTHWQLGKLYQFLGQDGIVRRSTAGKAFELALRP